MGDHKLAATVNLIDTRDTLGAAKKVLGDSTNILRDPSSSIHKKKRAVNNLLSVGDFMEASIGTLEEAKKRCAPFASSAIDTASKRMKGDGEVSSHALPTKENSPLQKVKACTTGSPTDAALTLLALNTAVAVEPRRTTRTLPTLKEDTVPPPINGRQHTRLEFSRHALEKPKGHPGRHGRGHFVQESLKRGHILVKLLAAYSQMEQSQKWLEKGMAVETHLDHPWHCKLGQQPVATVAEVRAFASTLDVDMASSKGRSQVKEWLTNMCTKKTCRQGMVPVGPRENWTPCDKTIQIHCAMVALCDNTSLIQAATTKTPTRHTAKRSQRSGMCFCAGSAAHLYHVVKEQSPAFLRGPAS